MARFTQSLDNFTTSHAKDVSSVASLAEERAQLDVQESDLRGLITKAEEKRGWFAAFTEWVESVATFLDEKVCK
jgi:GC-rich sequence DNA-binding factor